MRIFIINYYYPPVVNAHAYRWEQIARHWAAEGYQVEVISGRAIGVKNNYKDAGVSVKRVGLTAMPTGFSSNVNSNSGVIIGLRTSLLKLLRPIYRLLYWPDAMWHWVPSVILEILRRRATKYDLVVSYYPCAGAHLAAAVLKKWTKSAELIWIADYGDPFSTSITMPPNNFSLYRRLNEIFERYLLCSANACVFTNEDTAAKYEGLICQSEKVKVIPHLVDVKKFYAGSCSLSQSAAEFPSARLINLVYIGGFHREIREPTQLFELMRQLNKETSSVFRLTIYGPENGFNLSPDDCPYIEYKGEIQRGQAVELIGNADILINVDNKNCAMVPSKLVEYIGTGRPLINIGIQGSENLVLQRYVADGHAHLVTPDSLATVGIEPVKEFILSKLGSVAPSQDVLRALSGNTLEVVAGEYKKLFMIARDPSS